MMDSNKNVNFLNAQMEELMGKLDPKHKRMAEDAIKRMSLATTTEELKALEKTELNTLEKLRNGG